MFIKDNPFRKNAVSDAASEVMKVTEAEKAKYAEMTDQQLLESDNRLAKDEILSRKRDGVWTISEDNTLAQKSRETISRNIMTGKFPTNLSEGQVDELSRFTLSRYTKKASDDVDYRYNDTRPERKHRPDYIKKAEKKIRNKRTFGDSKPSEKSRALGEEDQIDELSKKKHIEYQQAAVKDQAAAGKEMRTTKSRSKMWAARDRWDKRNAGINKSVTKSRRMQEEEQIDEGIKSKLTPDEAHAVLKKHGSGKDTNFFSLSSSQVSGLVDHAKSIGYRKGRNAPGSTGRMYHDALQRHAAKSKMNEEQIDELSKKTLGSYINKAATDRHNKGYRSAEAMQKGDYKAAGKEIGDSIVKRQKGIERAVKKLTNEGAIKRDGAMDTYKKKPADYKPTKMGASYDPKRDKTKGNVDLNKEDEVEVNGKSKPKATKEKVSESVVDRALNEYRGRMKVLNEMRMSEDARELQLYIENDGQLYRQQTTSIMKNLQKKFEKGNYDTGLARKLWRYLVDAGAKKYVKEHGSPNDQAKNMFPGKVRDEVAAAMEADWKAELEAGNKI